MATFQIAETNEDSSSDDVTETPTNDTPILGWASGPNRDAAFIWRGTGIPQGATILTCTVTLTYGGGGAPAGPPIGDWWGFAVDTPSDFSSGHTTHRVSDHHTRTTASVADGPEGTSTHVTPSLVTIAQEIVNRGGFAGDIGLTWRNTGSTTNRYFTWKDYSAVPSTDAAILTITWTSGPTLAYDIIATRGTL